ncbi:MAG: glycosyltransferase family 1 protein, partial [Sphingobacteriales bacterium]
MTNRDIVIVGLQPWDIEIGSNCKNIALEFAKNNRVLYINPPIGRKTLMKDKAKPSVQKRLELIKSGNNLVQVDQNMWTLYPSTHIRSINWIPLTPVFRIFNKWNNIRFANDIRAAVEKLGFSNYILFNDSDMLRSYHLKELLKPAVSVYYSRDNLMVHKYWYRHGHILEPELMRKSDLVVANSTHLANVARKFNPKSFDVGQGCDLSIFDPNKTFTQPADIAAIKRPVIGYIGAVLSHRLDLQLLEELSKRKPEWNFVFVGKCDEEFSRSPIQQSPNVHFLGLKEERLLPDYLSSFDVAMNPQKINDYTIGNYPRKIDEYLALGKPVVATTTATMETFKDVTYLGETVDDYIRLIQKALDEDSPELQKKRMALAHTHTWENSVAGIYAA